MWVPKALLGLLSGSQSINESAFADLKEQVAALRAERDALRSELATLRVSGDWYRHQINILMAERSALVDKLYGISVPTPQLGSASEASNPRDVLAQLSNMSFDDVGDHAAPALGYPVVPTGIELQGNGDLASSGSFL